MQLCYKRKTQKQKPTTNWIDNINKKIESRRSELQIVGKHLRGETLTQVEQKTLNYIVAKRRYKRKEKETPVNLNDIQEIKNALENEIALYQKKLSVHFNKRQMRRDNYLFECNRKNFYRKIGDNYMNQDTIKISKTEIMNYWEPLFCQTGAYNENNIRNIVNKTLTPIQTNLDLDLRTEMIESLINRLPNWKAAGPD